MIIRDPIHGNIELTNAEKDLINNKVFQRLLYIRQLSMVYLAYPGAMHSRFEHSIGTMHLANKVGSGLGIDGDDLTELRIAALLHDIGHPAFSHVAEIFLKADHESMSAKMIKDSKLSRIMEKHGINVKKVLNIILNDKSISHQVIDNDIDVDRIDYLLRDAHHCGVAYGRAVDVDRLLYTLKRYKGSIVLDARGLEAAETLLFARYIMRETVYNHKTARIGDAMLCYCLSKALKNKVIKRSDLFRMTDSEVIYSLINSGDAEIAGHAKRLVERNLLKQAVVREYRELSDNEKLIIRRMASNWKLKEKKERELASLAGAGSGEVLIDLPKLPVMKESRIKVLSRNDLKPITKVSLMAKVINETYNNTWRMRIIADKKYVKKVSKNALKIIFK